MKKILILMMSGFIIVLLNCNSIYSQTLTQTAPEQYNVMLERASIFSDSVSIHPFPTARIIGNYLNVAKNDVEFDLDKEVKAYIYNSFNHFGFSVEGTNSKRPILKHFYKSPAHMFEINSPALRLRINPILDLKLGRGSIERENTFLNTRGIEIEGSIDNKVHFYSNIIENQGAFPDYINRYFDKFNALPGEGFVKSQEGASSGLKEGTLDWLDANAYLQFNASKSIGITFGHYKNFIGDGYRSLILSDFSDNYLNLKVDWRIGKKVHYQNIFAELSSEGFDDKQGNNLLKKKYLTTHTLSIAFSSRFNLYFSETVLFGREDGFELQYLNPIIFYRSVEGSVGSPDNVVLGLGGKYNVLNRFQVYGQFVLDEFRFKEIKAGNGWWGNKFGIQLGAKWINMLGIKNLDGQVEYNSARPYIYSHRDSVSSYAHYNQPLAHPLGANFRELIIKGRYQIGAKWFFDATLMYVSVGEDSADTNFGNNILVSHTTRGSEYGNSILQGVRSDILLGKLDISYMWKHNVFFDLSFIYRDQVSDDPSRNYNSTIINAGVRMNIRKREQIF